MTLLKQYIMLTMILLLVIFIPFNISKTYSQVLQEWSVRSSMGLSKSIDIDSFGNVYVGGNKGDETGIDFCLIKYSSSGNLQWTSYYDGPVNGLDFGHAIKLDILGNIIITGTSDGSGTRVDCATIKYSSSGKCLWVARYNGVENHDDVSYAVSIDKKCDIYITGSSRNNSGGRECLTIKYDSSGNQKWVAKYSRAINSFNEGYSITHDDSGNVYVTGISNGDFLTIKYNSIGIQQWVTFYNSPMNDNDGAESIGVDKFGNVYVSGSSAGSMFYYDYAVVKYNSKGSEQWVRRYDGSSHYMDQLRSMVVDSIGNIFITGNSTESGHGYDFTTIKYNSDGDTIWKASYHNGPNDIAFDISRDNSGNLYVTGESDGNGSAEDYATVKYDSSGNQIWVKRYDYSGQFGDYPYAIDIDDYGNVFVTGESNRDILTIKYSQLTGVNPILFENRLGFKLDQNYPNPFNPETVINYHLQISSEVKLKIYNILGNEIETLVDEKQNSGSYSVTFDGSSYPSGVYLYRLVINENVIDTKRMLLLK